MRRTGSIYECLVGLGILVSSLVSTVEARPFFFFLLANPGIRAYFDFDAEADGQKRAKSSTSSQNRLSFRAGRAKCKGWLFEKEKNRETCHDLVSLARTAYWLYNIGIE